MSVFALIRNAFCKMRILQRFTLKLSEWLPIRKKALVWDTEIKENKQIDKEEMGLTQMMMTASHELWNMIKGLPDQEVQTNFLNVFMRKHVTEDSAQRFGLILNREKPREKQAKGCKRKYTLAV